MTTPATRSRPDPPSAADAPTWAAPIARSGPAVTPRRRPARFGAPSVQQRSRKGGCQTINSGIPANRFIKVEPHDEEPAAWHQDIWQSLGSPQVLVPLVGLLVLLATGWYLLRPPSPAALFAKIDRLVSAGNVDDLLEAEGPIDEFLRLYPDDARAPEVTGFREQLSLARVERRFDREARRLSNSEGLTAVERAYLVAVHLAPSDPEQAAWLDFGLWWTLCEASPEESENDSPRVGTIAAASRSARRAGTTRNARPPRIGNGPEEEFERAEKIAAKDPAAARKIWEAIVELFSDKPAASEIVEKARGALAERVGSRN